MELEYRFRSTGFLIEHEGTDYPRIDVYNAVNNIVTNTPSEQVGEQSEEKWEGEYRVAGGCDCDDNIDCPGGGPPTAFCCEKFVGGDCDCTVDGGTGRCLSCLDKDQWGCDYNSGHGINDACCGSNCIGSGNVCACEWE